MNIIEIENLTIYGLKFENYFEHITVNSMSMIRAKEFRDTIQSIRNPKSKIPNRGTRNPD